ncbi:MAG: hypothetical protein LBG70_02995 [Bifidobacteriaceae bacterium]|jgi:hypothetical protein|nr:hypothetical protein [Bifidobacteriaceae bacterium]
MKSPRLFLAVAALSLVGATFTALPSSASLAGQWQAEPAICTAKLNSLKGAVAFDSIAYTLAAKPGAKVTLKFTVNKGCTGTLKAYLGKKVVKQAKFKKAKATLVLPKAKLKAAKKYALTLTYTRSSARKAAKQKYDLWTYKGSVKPASSAVDVYQNNQTPLDVSLSWVGPQSSSSYLMVTTAAWSAKSPLATSVDYKSLSNVRAKQTVKLLLDGDRLGQVGANDIKLRYLPSMFSADTHPSLVSTATVRVNVLSNVLEGGAMLPAGTYRFTRNEYGGCSVNITGSTRNYNGTGVGTKYFLSSEVDSIAVLPTDTKVVFSNCIGGPVKIG